MFTCGEGLRGGLEGRARGEGSRGDVFKLFQARHQIIVLLLVKLNYIAHLCSTMNASLNGIDILMYFLCIQYK